MRIEKITIAAADSQRKGDRRLIRRRDSWQQLDERCRTCFTRFKDALEKQNIDLPILIKPGDCADTSFKTITIEFGKEKTGVADFRNQSGTRAVLQHGCALHIAQGLYGEVTVMLYPYWNSLLAEKVRPYIYRTISKPWNVKKRHIHLWLRLLVALAHWSSYRGKTTISDWFWLKWIQARSLLRHIYHSDWSRAAQIKVDRAFGKHPEENSNDSEQSTE